MSLETLDTKIERLRADATQRISTYRDFSAAVQADSTLTLEGKTQKLEGTRERVQREVSSLQEQETTAVAAEILSLERTIGGTAGSAGVNVISFRDAQDRAARATNPTEALTGLRTAITTDDRELARAYLMRAVTQRDQDPVAQALDHMDGGSGDVWSTVVQEYIDAYPATAQAVTDLYNLRHRERSLQYSFRSAGAYVVL